MRDKKPTFRRGDRVQLRRCPSHPSLETHAAKVTGDPYFTFSEWVMPIRYWCAIERKTAIVKCADSALIRRGFKFKMKLSKPAIVTSIVLIVLLFVGLWFGGNYNNLVSSKAQVDNSWAKVETQYQRRLDLIDNIVSSVKGAQTQEKQVFIDLAKARSGIVENGSTNDKAAAASQSESTIVSIVPKLQEAYPELKSNQQVQALVDELKTTENTIATVRDKFNDTVTNYNVNITRFPKNTMANLFGFDKQNLYKADANAKNAPKVNLQ